MVVVPSHRYKCTFKRQKKKRASLWYLMNFYYPFASTNVGQIEQGVISDSLKDVVRCSCVCTCARVCKYKSQKSLLSNLLQELQFLMSSFLGSMFSFWHPGQMASMEIFLLLYSLGDQGLVTETFSLSDCGFLSGVDYYYFQRSYRQRTGLS